MSIFIYLEEHSIYNLTYFLSSTSSSIWWLVRANIRILHRENCERSDKMYGIRIVKPPSSYSHQTSILPQCCVEWKMPSCVNSSLGTVVSGFPLRTSPGFSSTFVTASVTIFAVNKRLNLQNYIKFINKKKRNTFGREFAGNYSLNFVRVACIYSNMSQHAWYWQQLHWNWSAVVLVLSYWHSPDAGNWWPNYLVW